MFLVMTLVQVFKISKTVATNEQAVCRQIYIYIPYIPLQDVHCYIAYLLQTIMDVINSNKGNNKIIHNNFMFVKKKELKCGSIVWECTKRRRSGCKASLKTDQFMNGPVLSGEHNHTSSAAIVNVEKVRQTLKQRCVNSKERPKQMLAEELQHLDQEAMGNLGQVDAIKRDIQRHQRKENHNIFKIFLFLKTGR